MKYFSILLVIITLSSCKKNTNDGIIYGYEYFPITEGNYVVYDVLDVFHDEVLIPAHDSTRYQVKEVIGETEVDGHGEEYQKLRRYHRANDTLTWTLQDVWTIKRTSRNAEMLEENQRVVKMAFAISYDQFWDCNALNPFDKEECYYSRIYQPFSIPAYDFDSTVRVERQDFSTYIEYIRSFDVYAPRIGLIHSTRKDIRINNGDTLDVAYGTELFYTAIEWGQE